ncbi:hypothetical protein WKK05_25725 [Nostoc sp. UHCC 0302]|uniref:hypothetical protein n=1 Tax=Nostoc sp. UHCC 0302 TaxID=3134896 RepID=UPI00311C914F
MREVLQEERLRLCQILIPYISDDEQSKLEAEFGSPLEDADDELIDMTDWVKNRNQIINTSNSDRPLGGR